MTTTIPKRKRPQGTHATRLLAAIERRGGALEYSTAQAMANALKIKSLRSLYFAIERLELDGLIRVTRTPSDKPLGRSGPRPRAIRLEVV